MSHEISVYSIAQIKFYIQSTEKFITLNLLHKDITVFTIIRDIFVHKFKHVTFGEINKIFI